MNKPTEEQIKRFWEQCGFSKGVGGWTYCLDEGCAYPDYPPIDLSNLFKYAVPKLIRLDGTAQGGVEFRFYPGGTSCILTLEDEAGVNEVDYFLENEYDSALALFWAIWGVFEHS